MTDKGAATAQGSASAPAELPPHPRFPVVNKTQEEEDNFDLQRERALTSPTGVFGTVAYMIKGALGAGILGGHAAFANAGMIAVPVTMLLGIYMTYCLHLLVNSAQIIYKRTAINKGLSYSDVGEASFAISSSKTVRKLSNYFRYFIDLCICLDLFGACCCYQLMISGTIKQVVENTQNTSLLGLTPSYPSLKIYMLIMMVPIILICLVRKLHLLARISILGNVFVLMCVFATIYYSLKKNPTMKGMKLFTSFKGLFTFIGMTVFSMSCSGIVISLETNLKNPATFPLALVIGMIAIVICIIMIALFGYSAYGEDSKAPITFHFPMEVFPIVLKVAIALMLYITHAVNFWVPFNLLFHYLQKFHRESRQLLWEYIYRAIICVLITFLGIIFPSVNKLMSFLGAFCLSNMAFIFPAVIRLCVVWERPGLGKYKWRLIMSCFLIFIGLIMFAAGTYVSVEGLIEIFVTPEEMIDKVDTIHPND